MRRNTITRRRSRSSCAASDSESGAASVSWFTIRSLVPTLAAAELNERICFGIELDPKYVDVIVQRWQALTNKKATLDGDGQTFEEVKSVRGDGDQNG